MILLLQLNQLNLTTRNNSTDLAINIQIDPKENIQFIILCWILVLIGIEGNEKVNKTTK